MGKTLGGDRFQRLPDRGPFRFLAIGGQRGQGFQAAAGLGDGFGLLPFLPQALLAVGGHGLQALALLLLAAAERITGEAQQFAIEIR